MGKEFVVNSLEDMCALMCDNDTEKVTRRATKHGWKAEKQMTNKEAIANLEMISIAFVEPVTKEQRKLINDTFKVAIEALKRESED